MIFSLFDVKAEVFGQLFEARTPDEAKRLFISLLLSGDLNSITQYPQDFQLYCLGDFNSLTGEIVASQPNSIMTGFEAMQIAKQYCISNTSQNVTLDLPKKSKSKSKTKNKKGGSDVIGHDNSSSSEDTISS